ncbi:transcription elongation factor, mitochondrial [Tachyglossus aculeatus]|uniref:transcription elongation factor, mitochondrial n=1 Tax=Tachyglossus aculeatus TaxID=9261 RepID=UPI0018F4C735|nr:transcription elongation factor, mitochondrial [Tachyglossus aculeatus]
MSNVACWALTRLWPRGRQKLLHIVLGLSPFQCLHLSSTHPRKKAYPDISSSAQNRKDTEPALENIFSSEQQHAILRVLNTASAEELAEFRLLRGRKSVNIVEHREKHGPFVDLQNLLDVPLFQYKTTVQVCHSILLPTENEKKEKIQASVPLGRLIRPEIERARLKSVKSIVSVVFGSHKLAWAHLDRKLTVLDWQQEECSRLMRGDYASPVYLEEVSSIISMMPEADFYVLEKNRLSLQQTSLFPLTLHFHIMEAMLHALLNKTFMQDGQHRVLSLNRITVGKHFGLMVGNNRTSGKDLVKQILTCSVTEANPHVSFLPDNVVHYQQMFSPVAQKRDEEMYDSLLQAVAFYELAVFKAYS